MKIPANEVCRSCGWLIELARSASALNADTVTGTVCAFSLTRRAVTTISPMPESVGVSVAGGTDGMLPPTEPVCAPCAAATPDEPRTAADATQIGRAHVCTPVTNAHLVCRLLLEKKK